MENNFLLFADSSVNSIYDEIDILVVGFCTTVYIQLTLKKFRLMRAGKYRELFNQLFALFGCDKP